MAERNSPIRNIKVIVRPGTRKLKISLIILLLVSAAALIALGVVSSRIQNQTQALLDQAAELEQENAELTDRTEQIDSDNVIKEIAQEELGLVDPDTVILDPNSQ